MDSSGSFLKTVIWRVRAAIDLPDVDDRWNDDLLIRHAIQPSFTNIWSKINLGQTNYVVMKHRITVSTETPYYQLPPNVGNILKVIQIDPDNNDARMRDFVPHSIHNFYGSNWRLEGNLLTLDPIPTSEDVSITLEVWYVPVGDTILHYADGSASSSRGTLSEDADGVLNTLTLCTTPTLGELEHRPNGLAGMVLRVLKKSDSSVLVRSEHIIATHDAATGVVTTRTPVDSAYTDTDTVAYEIAPLYHDSFYDAVAYYTVWKLAIKLGESRGRQEGFFALYKDALKSFRDNVNNMQARSHKSFAIDTPDNVHYGPYNG